ncbi:sulfatase-like hydrolase/transferase [Muriicola jejuensis]|uniref:Sulfatase-like hydrolase/transferase n=2 Tax=Muriicola jejuensis TaxID=504488 RepID=A0A6P0U9S6_9FLAO|nr:sulfatase-like hydrolase/transferase [Muriicola jejuensis]
MLTVFLLLNCSGQPVHLASEDRPNILVLVADDLGYSDLGCYGGEILTPILDSLALEGIRFTNFHTAPMCAPSRAMLLTGNDNHIAGLGRQALEVDVFGYEGHITDRVAPLPDILREYGYHTYMAGKWHLGAQPEYNPHMLGFERSFVLLEGVGNHFNSEGFFGTGSTSHYTEDGKESTWPEGSFSTDHYTDKLLGYIDAKRADRKPFFAYAAFTAPHWPLQVEKKYSEKYRGKYDGGYEDLRERRFTALKEAGLIPPEATLPALHPSVPPWDSLSEEEKKKESRKMEIYAGMVDNLDHNIGRILRHLKEIGEYENTLIIFISDNGAAGEDYFSDPNIRPYVNAYFNDEYATMGEADSFISYGPPWAEASTPAFRYFKEYSTNGGIITPMIIAGPMVKNANSISKAFASIMDIAPTVLELAGTSYPDTWKGRPVYPMRGESLLPLLTGGQTTVHADTYVFALEHAEYTMLQKGHWKIISIDRPFRKSGFGLFDLSKDPGEQHDLRQIAPEKYRELLLEWDAFSREVRLQFPR